MANIIEKNVIAEEKESEPTAHAFPEYIYVMSAMQGMSLTL